MFHILGQLEPIVSQSCNQSTVICIAVGFESQVTIMLSHLEADITNKITMFAYILQSQRKEKLQDKIPCRSMMTLARLVCQVLPHISEKQYGYSPAKTLINEPLINSVSMVLLMFSTECLHEKHILQPQLISDAP